MAQGQIWYRMGFRQTTPEFEQLEEVGSNNSGKVPTFFLAPKDPETGETHVTQMRTIQADQNGNPNGHYATPDEARQAVVEHINQQIEAMQQAVASAEKCELPGNPDLKLSE